MPVKASGSDDPIANCLLPVSVSLLLNDDFDGYKAGLDIHDNYTEDDAASDVLTAPSVYAEEGRYGS